MAAVADRRLGGRALASALDVWALSPDSLPDILSLLTRKSLVLDNGEHEVAAGLAERVLNRYTGKWLEADAAAALARKASAVVQQDAEHGFAAAVAVPGGVVQQIHQYLYEARGVRL